MREMVAASRPAKKVEEPAMRMSGGGGVLLWSGAGFGRWLAQPARVRPARSRNARAGFKSADQDALTEPPRAASQAAYSRRGMNLSEAELMQ